MSERGHSAQHPTYGCECLHDYKYKRVVLHIN